MNNIAFYRTKHGLTQKEFGEMVGMHVHAVGYAEHHTCSVKLAKQTAEILRENIFDIMGTDILKVLPKTEEEKQIIISMIKEL